MAFSAVRSGLTVLPPGSRALMSVTLVIWRCERALVPNFREVFIPSLSRCAVTTTLLSANVLSDSFIVSSEMSFLTVNVNALST